MSNGAEKWTAPLTKGKFRPGLLGTNNVEYLLRSRIIVLAGWWKNVARESPLTCFDVCRSRPSLVMMYAGDAPHLLWCVQESPLTCYNVCRSRPSLVMMCAGVAPHLLWCVQESPLTCYDVCRSHPSLVMMCAGVAPHLLWWVQENMVKTHQKY